ncbi:MAG: hypothetical protein WDM88_06400 [Galbitalea sp.]
MTDSSPWQSPSGPPPTTPASSGPPAPPGGIVPPPAPPAWTPPPRPGLVPLQPLTLGTILSASFRVLRRNPRPTFGLALLIEAVIVVASAALVGFVYVVAFSRLTNAASDRDAATIANGSVGLVLLAELVVVVLSVFGLAILQGIISLEVARGTVGEKLTLRGLWRQGRGRLGALIGWFWALVGAALLAYVLLIVVIAILVAMGGAGGTAVAVVFAVLAFLAALVLLAWLYPKLSFVPAALLVERLTLGRAIARSWTLTRGYFWRTLGIELLVTVIINVATSVVTFPLEFALIILTGLFGQTGDHGTLIVIGVIVGGLGVVLTVVVGAVASVVQSASQALLYIDLRMRKEALDLDLIRFVEARQVGDESVLDPYLATARPRPAEFAPAGPTPAA